MFLWWLILHLKKKRDRKGFVLFSVKDNGSEVNIEQSSDGSKREEATALPPRTKLFLISWGFQKINKVGVPSSGWRRLLREVLDAPMHLLN